MDNLRVVWLAESIHPKDMQTRFFLSLLIAIFLIAGCGGASNKTTSESSASAAHQSLITQAIEAHGGIDSWRSYRTLAFDYVSARGEQRSQESIMLDLQTRHERISGANYEMGYNGTDYWQLLGEEGMEEKNPTFFINLQFYFFAMPFVLADDGIVEESLGKKELNGKTYEVVKITFEAGTGVAPEDQYIVYLDPETKRMEALLYSVTYFNKDNAEKYSALHYTEWQEASGLVVPKVIQRYAWDADKEAFGEARGEKLFPKVAFSATAPDARIFAKPEGAL